MGCQHVGKHPLTSNASIQAFKHNMCTSNVHHQRSCLIEAFATPQLLRTLLQGLQKGSPSVNK